MQNSDRYSNEGTVWMDVFVLHNDSGTLKRMSLSKMIVVSFALFMIKSLLWPEPELIMNVGIYFLILSVVNMIDEMMKVSLYKGVLVDLSKHGYSKSIGWKPNRGYKQSLSKMSDQQLVDEFEMLIDERISNNKMGEVYYMDYMGRPSEDNVDHSLWECDFKNKGINSKLNYIRDNKSYRERIMESKKDA